LQVGHRCKVWPALFPCKTTYRQFICSLGVNAGILELLVYHHYHAYRI
jgi:hypothetical protein